MTTLVTLATDKRFYLGADCKVSAGNYMRSNNFNKITAIKGGYIALSGMVIIKSVLEAFIDDNKKIIKYLQDDKITSKFKFLELFSSRLNDLEHLINEDDVHYEFIGINKYGMFSLCNYSGAEWINNYEVSGFGKEIGTAVLQNIYDISGSGTKMIKQVVKSVSDQSLYTSSNCDIVYINKGK